VREPEVLSTSRHLRAADLADGPWLVSVTPEQAGWAYCGLRVLRLDAGGWHAFGTGPDEAVLLPLAGACVVECDGERFALAGRAGVFAGPADFAYLPRDARVRVSSADGGRFAVASARAAERLAPAPGGCTTSACPGCSMRTG